MRKPTPEEAVAIAQALHEHAVRTLVERSCAEQGLPIKITDPAVVAQVATLLGAPARRPR
jgi:hypothetical protein